MLGGSAANVAVHIANLRRGRVGFSGTESGDVGVEGATEAASAGRAGPVAKPIDGVGCHLHSSIASDTMGNILRNDLEELGVNWSQSREPRHQGTCVVLTGREDRSFVTHRGSVAEFCRDDIDVPRLLASSHVHVAGFYNCPALADDLPGLLAEARAGGATCSLGPQWDASERWGGLDSLYPLLDVFISNENEARSISRCENIAQAASFFLDRGVGLVVVSRGADGAVALSRESGARTGEGLGESGTRSLTKWDQTSSKAEVVDTTGAGDAFSAGFLYVWKATGDVQAALRWGCALGSTLVTRVGASMRLSVEEDIRPRLVP
ncbi:unnamed protein product [Ascophyllum nodosum]